MKSMFAVEEARHGTNAEYEGLKSKLLEQVIPRLLGPLVADGRRIKPCLVHSDLWPGNIKVDADNGLPVIFDSCAFWGHNEADMGCWRADRYNMPGFKEYYVEKHKHLIAEPFDEWDDRNLLYGL